MRVLPAEFQTFWNNFPRRVGRLAAIKAYAKARREFSAEEILVGLKNYVQHMPAEQRFQVHPATFLNQGRFLDEYDAVPVLRTASDWGEDCKRLHGGKCACRWDHDMKMRESA